MAFIPPTPDRIDTGNSSTTPLAGNATFTGTAVDVTTLPIGAVTVFAFSDVASAVNGLQLQWSQDSTNWTDHSQNDTVNPSSSGIISDKPRARYYRVVYTNGSGAQGIFRLQTIQSVTNTSGTVRDLDTAVQGDDEAQLVRAVLTGQSAPGSKFTPVKTDVAGALLTTFGGQSLDAFGRGRVGTPTALFGANFQYNAQPLLFDTVVTGGGTATKTSNESSVTLNTGGTTNGDGVFFQSHRFWRYEPGKSQNIVVSGSLGAKKANVRSRIGAYYVNDGCYFEMDGTNGAAVNIRTSTSGSPVDSPILQANWNLDKMDGTGTSGVTIDFSKDQIFIVDYQWLGTGRVRFGFIVDGLIIYCHQVLNANNLTSPYMNTGTVPIRAEIFNTGVAASGTTMKIVCCSAISEGGEEAPVALQFTTNNGTTTIAVTTRRPVLSISPATTFNSITNHIALRPMSMTVYSDNPIIWELVYNGTLTGASFAAVDATNSGATKDVSATAISGGVVVDSGYLSNGAKISGTIALSLSQLLAPTISAAGTADIFSVVITSLGGTANSAASLTWEERR